MDQNQRKMANILGDIILIAYTQANDPEEKMEIPLMIEIPVSWINFIRELTPGDPFTTVELSLRMFFNTGVASFLREMQKLYASPHDIVRKYEKLMSK